jgi:hypothetical protein
MYKVVVNYNKTASEQYDSMEAADEAVQALLKEPDPTDPASYQGMGLEQPYEVLIVEVKKGYTKKVEYDLYEEKVEDESAD